MKDRWLDRLFFGGLLLLVLGGQWWTGDRVSAQLTGMQADISGQLADVRERLARVETHLEYLAAPTGAVPDAAQQK